MEKHYFLKLRRQAVNRFCKGNGFSRMPDLIIGRKKLKCRMPQDYFFQPRAAPKITAAVQRNFKKPGLFPTCKKNRTILKIPDKNILSNIFS